METVRLHDSLIGETERFYTNPDRILRVFTTQTHSLSDDPIDPFWLMRRYAERQTQLAKHHYLDGCRRAEARENVWYGKESV